jgi:hypothetical protein
MCSDQSWKWEWTPAPAPAIASFAAPAEVPYAHPVWVDLERLFRHEPEHARSVYDGLDTTGRARGFLTERVRAGLVDWLGVVNYQLHYADGRPQPVIFNEQFVPFYALQPRTNKIPLDGPR